MTEAAMIDPDGASLLIVEDDPTFARTLRRSFERRGYRVSSAGSPDEAETLSEDEVFDYAVVDLKLGASSGLAVVQSLHARSPETRIVVLTGYASIATAVEAIKLGASHYLAKPSNTDDIEAAFTSIEGTPASRSTGGAVRSRRWNGSISTALWWNANSTYPRPRAASAFIAARSPASWKSARSSLGVLRPA